MSIFGGVDHLALRIVVPAGRAPQRVGIAFQQTIGAVIGVLAVAQRVGCFFLIKGKFMD